MPCATKCSYAELWIASWRSASGFASTPCASSSPRKSATLESHRRDTVARCAESISARHPPETPFLARRGDARAPSPPRPSSNATLRRAPPFDATSFSTTAADSSSSSSSSSPSVGPIGSALAPFTWSLSASTTPVSPSRNPNSPSSPFVAALRRSRAISRSR